MPEIRVSAANADNAAGQTPIRPERMCVICRCRFPKVTLTRYVLSPQEMLTVDTKKNKPGRGCYLCSDPGCALKFEKYRPGKRRRGKHHV